MNLRLMGERKMDLFYDLTTSRCSGLRIRFQDWAGWVFPSTRALCDRHRCSEYMHSWSLHVPLGHHDIVVSVQLEFADEKCYDSLITVLE